MASLTPRQIWRRDRSATIRQERTITGYIRAKYPEIYSEAVNVYNVLNKNHPNKFDLRKLPEFREKCQDSSSKKYPNIPQGYTEEDPNKVQEDPNKFRDTMELRIPLLPNTATTTLQASGDLQDTATLQASGDLQDTVTSTLQASGDLQDQPFTPTGSEVPEPAQCVQLGEIEQDLVDKIVADLENDPDIYRFFENIDVEQLSPLEAELLLY